MLKLTIKNGVRQSSAEAYLRVRAPRSFVLSVSLCDACHLQPAEKKYSNLVLRTQAHVTRVNLNESNTAEGVSFCKKRVLWQDFGFC